MTDIKSDCLRQYLPALLGYLAQGGETALHGAYELGRKAVVDGLGCLEMLAIHQECITTALGGVRTPENILRITEQAGRFLAEILSPFEMSLRGFRDTNVQLTRNIKDLLAAEAELRDQRDRLLKAEAEQRDQRDKLLVAHRALETERLRYRDLFDFAPDGYLVTGLDGTIVEANRAAEALLGVPAGELTGSRLAEWVPDDAREVVALRTRELVEGNADAAQEWQLEIVPRGGACFPVALGVRAVRNADGLPVSLRLLLRDVTERKRIEEERAQLLVREQVARAQGEAAQRFAFLASISALLVASFDCETTLGGVAGITVPYLADSCLFFLTDSANGIRLLCGAHADPSRADRARALSRVSSVLNARSVVAGVLENGRTAIYSSPTGDLREAGREVDPDAFRFLLEEDFASLLLVPMQSHRGVLGLIVLAAVEPGYYNYDRAALAEDLARRCALAVENSHLYRAMVVERDKAAEANRAKDEFLGLLGHELRNPLVPILGWSRNLGKQRAVAGEPALRQGVEAIERNALNILRLADDCLDLARISERKVALEWELLDLNQTVRDSIGALRLLAQDKHLAIESHLSPGELWVTGDRTRLEQVMYNLLVNAVKYTGSGGVISVSSVRIDNAAELEIKDTGIGIAPEFLEQVFQPFRRGDREWHKSDASLGLGLAIARKIVELHGGTIWAESPGMGGGSAFHLRLKIAQEDEPAAGSHVPARRKQAEANPLRVLLIDDHKDTTDLIRIELESLGYSVLTAADGETGLEIAMHSVPDVIVSDLRLPRLDGYELIRRLRRVPGMAAIPAIALTGMAMKKDLEAALAAGFDSYLNKPAEVNELSDLVQELTNRRRAGAASP